MLAAQFKGSVLEKTSQRERVTQIEWSNLSDSLPRLVKTHCVHHQNMLAHMFQAKRKILFNFLSHIFIYKHLDIIYFKTSILFYLSTCTDTV